MHRFDRVYWQQQQQQQNCRAKCNVWYRIVKSLFSLSRLLFSHVPSLMIGPRVKRYANYWYLAISCILCVIILHKRQSSVMKINKTNEKKKTEEETIETFTSTRDNGRQRNKKKIGRGGEGLYARSSSDKSYDISKMTTTTTVATIPLASAFFLFVAVGSE